METAGRIFTGGGNDFTMPGVPASAVEADVSAASGNASAECICETHCEQGAVNPDCPVCAAEDADLSACLGKEAAVLSVQAMINALPDEPTEENAEDVSAKLGEIDEAMAALGDEERAALDLTQYQQRLQHWRHSLRRRGRSRCMRMIPISPTMVRVQRRILTKSRQPMKWNGSAIR